jgi:hypothetical protein
MSGRVPSDPALDDWFDEPQPRGERTAGTVSSADDWPDGDAETSRERAALAVGALGRRRALLAVAGAVVLALVGLAVGGVFSGGSSTPERGATSAPTTASIATTSPAAPAGPATQLNPGAKGTQVKALQQTLAALGYSPGKIDGSYGPATQKAVASFQRASKLSPGGPGSVGSGF